MACAMFPSQLSRVRFKKVKPAEEEICRLVGKKIAQPLGGLPSFLGLFSRQDLRV